MAPLNVNSAILGSLLRPDAWLLIGVLAVVGYVVYERFLSPCAGIPGPFFASLSRWWMIKHTLEGDMHRVMIQQHEKYGSLVRTGPNELSISDLSAIRKIYGPGSKFRKSDWYSVWQGHRKFDLFAERNESIHGAQRKLVARAYAMETLKDLEEYVNNATRVFIQRMDEMQDQVVDMGKWVQLYAFDVIGEITFSKRFGFMDVGEDDGTFGAIEGILGSASWIGQVPWLFWLHDYLQPVIGNHLKVNARHGGVRNFAAREVAARKDRGSDHNDILSKLFAVQKDKPEFEDTSVLSMATSNVAAGSDTTAISLRAMVWYLLKYPECKQKLVEEIDERRRQGKLSDPVQLEEADQMPYLQAVMWEALRLHPAVGMSLPRVVPVGGTEFDGHYLPAGTIVGVNPWVVQRNKEVYGEDVETFRPERWLNKEDKGDMQRYFFAFGAGARLCIGKNISWLEMSKLIPTLFMHFDITLEDSDAELKETCWWFVIQKGLNVKLNRRIRA
ncbi:cytochrome P450 [Rhizodiscina lignyota]|uniref:Cytochrome P450 n=1 Tax=Rhizodiscina lignyota TaxID=1504668 RepID=A0A9P4M1R2_9PEZI|nr:cytochrome P450 [Rhizodiscina lignyota]